MNVVIARSVAVVMVVLSVEVLFAVFGSDTAETTERAFARAVVDVGERESDTVMVADPPDAIVPRAQVTVPEDCEHVPWFGVADPKVVPVGSVSRSVTAVAALGPAFETVSV